MAIFCSTSEFESLCSDIAGKARILRLQAKGGSMFPFIRSGDWVDLALRGQEKNNIKKGDIILFRKDENLYLHRVLCRGQDGFLVKGDMSFGSDGVISADDLLGRVVALRRGKRSIDLNTKLNRFIAVLAADSSLLLQYPVLLLRKMCSFNLAILSGIQGFKAYRFILKKVFTGETIIRLACPEDEEQLRDLYLMSGRDIQEGIAAVRNEGFWLVAERKRRIVGGLTMTRYEKDSSIWLIFGLEVKPIFRGLGIGRKIVAQAVLKAGESGAARIGLFVNKKSFPALALYRKLGFTQTDVFPPEFSRAGDELYLAYEFPK